MPHEELTLISLFYLLIGNLAILLSVGGIFLLFMMLSGYKSITIKLRKDKENKKLNKYKNKTEQIYMNKLEQKIKKKK